MVDLILNLLPLVVGAAVAPLYTIAVLLLLQSERGLLKSAALVTGAILVRLIQGAILGRIIGASCKSYSEPGPRLIVSTLLLTLGILLLVTALRKFRKQDDVDSPPPRWMRAIEGLSLRQAFGAGVLFPMIAVKQWVFTLSAIGVIGQLGPGGLADASAFLFFALATQSLVLAPILAMAVAPHLTAQPLQVIQTWLTKNDRTIVVMMSTIFGAWFSYKGAIGLIG